jgi:MSHA biogenesis protein MshM
MPLATLEEIRLLSNLETKHDKLLQIVLFGQPELDINLNQTNIRQLRERITHSFYLSPFKPKEIGDYLIFRLRAAGYYGPHLFTDKAIQKISNAAEGLVRRVNILADKSMLAAFADNVYQITPKHVNAAIADSEFGAEAAKKKTKKHIMLGLAGMVALGLLAGFGWYYWQKNDLQSRFFPEQLPEIAPQKDLTLPPLLEPAAQTEAKPNENTALAVEVTPSTSTENTPVTTEATSAVQAPITTSPAEVAPQFVAAPDAALPVSAASNPVTPIAALPTEQPPAIVGATNVAQTNTAQINAADDLLQARIDLTKDWLNTQSRDTVTIQLMGVADEWELKKYLSYLSQQIELDNIYVYRTKVNNQPFLTVLYGTFADRQLANEALQKLPAKLRQNRPHLRTVGGILDETNKNQ